MPNLLHWLLFPTQNGFKPHHYRKTRRCPTAPKTDDSFNLPLEKNRSVRYQFSELVNPDGAKLRGCREAAQERAVSSIVAEWDRLGSRGGRAKDNYVPKANATNPLKALAPGLQALVGRRWTVPRKFLGVNEMGEQFGSLNNSGAGAGKIRAGIHRVHLVCADRRQICPVRKTA